MAGGQNRETAPSAWRFRRLGVTRAPGPWWGAATLRDAQGVIGDGVAEIQKRTGTARSGYQYEAHSTTVAYEYEIEGWYGYEGGWERVHTETDKAEAQARLDEYVDAEKRPFRIRRVKADA